MKIHEKVRAIIKQPNGMIRLIQTCLLILFMVPFLGCDSYDQLVPPEEKESEDEYWVNLLPDSSYSIETADITHDNKILVALKPAGLAIITPDEESLTNLDYNLPVKYLDITGDVFAFSADYTHNIYFGKTAGFQYQAIKIDDIKKKITGVFVLQNATLLVAAKDQGIYYSSDSLITNQNLENKTIVDCIEAGKNLFVATQQSGLFCYNFEKKLWENKNWGLNRPTLTVFARNFETLYVGTDGKGVFCADFDGIYWNKIEIDGLFNRHINTAICNSDGDLFVGTDNGVFRLKNGGNYWRQYGQFSNQSIKRLLLNTKNELLVVLEKGIFTSNTSTIKNNKASQNN